LIENAMRALHQNAELSADGLSEAREQLYERLQANNMTALWQALGSVTSRSPRPESVPHLWRWNDVRPLLADAGRLVTPQEAERRVLMLINPSYPGKSLRTVGMLYGGIQMICPGEVADSHRHAPNAQRFIIEGDGVYMNVDGERCMASKGDFVVTPSWAWHDHGNESDHDMVWLDILDIAFCNLLDANFFEDWEGNGAAPPLTVPDGDSTRRWGRNMRPTWIEDGRSERAALIRYNWGDARDTLRDLRADQGSPFDGIILQYTDPRTGGPTMPTIASSLQLLRKGEHTCAHRHTSSTIYHVAEGAGRTIIDQREFCWVEGDTFTLPSWAWHEHEPIGGEAVLFSYTDRPILDAFGWYREEPHPDRYQS
jgi:gentisate 1,2-dioxygenase